MNFSRLEAYIDYLSQTLRVPALDCCVHVDGKNVFRKSGGVDFDSRRDLYHMYSVTKPVTCAAALKLTESGKLRLCDPLYKYFPQFRNINVRKKTIDGRGFELKKAEKPILIKHLFTMTAGFDYNIHGIAIRKYIKQTAGRFPTKLIAQALSEQPLDFEPGTHWKYSLCHDVLGALIEEITGKTLNDYVSETIFKPLGMESSTLLYCDNLKERIMPQKRFDAQSLLLLTVEGNEHVLGSEYHSGGAGLISSVDDMMLFCDMLSCGGMTRSHIPVLSPQTIELMKTNQLPAMLFADIARATNQAGYGYGLGVRTMVNPLGADSLSPIGEFGWGGASGSYLLADTQNHISMFFAQNLLGASLTHHHRLRNILYTCI